MRAHHLREILSICRVGIGVAAAVFLMSMTLPIRAQQPARAIPLALENVTLEVQADGTLTRVESRATEPIIGQGSAAEAEASGRARQRVFGQLSRFLANERAVGQALQQSLKGMTPTMTAEATNRLLADLSRLANVYRARALPPAEGRGTKSADGSTVSFTATLKGPFTGVPSAGLAPGAEPGGVAGGMAGGVVGGLPAAPPTPSANAPVKVGGNVMPPTKVKDVAAVYPAIAQSARVSGMVLIEVTIGADGKVKAATVVKSIPLLDAAALDAVRQWEFTPTLLNGVPVPVLMTVNVNFTLK